MKIGKVAVITVVFCLQGCVWAPGQHLDQSSLTRSGSAEKARYDLVPITPKLIAMDKASQHGAEIPPALLEYKPESYHIGPGDSLFITVWDHPELTSPAGMQQQTAANGRIVRPDGTLFYPYVGVLKAAGLTLEDLRQAISDRLTKYVEKPQVDVNVVGYGSQRLTLSGAFLKTDPQPTGIVPLTLGQAIGAATINVAQANLSGFVLTRDGVDYHLDLDALSREPHGMDSIWLKPNDQLFLPFNDRQEAYVLGEVTRPMAIQFKTADLNLTQALGKAGGLSQLTSKGKAVYVIRGVEDMEKAPAQIYQLDASSPVAFAVGSQFSVHPGDVVFVGAAGITRWNRFLSQLLPLSGIISQAANTQYYFDRAGN